MASRRETGSPGIAASAPRTSGQAIVETLVRNGVRHVFGVPGVHTYEIFDALHQNRDRLTYVGARHEQGAGYMAYGYATSTGALGVYTCVPGPGILNSGAALATAYANRPLIMLGSGAVGAGEEVLALARRLQAPVTAHRTGRGIVGEDLACGLSLAAAYDYWQTADLLIAIGTRMELQFIRWRTFP